MNLPKHPCTIPAMTQQHNLSDLNDDEWTCTGATTAKEATKLVEDGFQYVTTIEGIQLFRKRK